MDSAQTYNSSRRSPKRSHYSRSRSRSSRRSRSYSRDRDSRSPAYGYRHSDSRYESRHYPTRDNPAPSRCLGVFGLSLETQEPELHNFFSRFGDIEDINLVYDNYSGRSRGFGFVYFRHVSDAKIAKEEAQGMKLDGRYVRVDYSITARPHSPTPGIYMGRSSTRRSNHHSYRYRDSRSRSRSTSYDRRY